MFNHNTKDKSEAAKENMSNTLNEGIKYYKEHKEAMSSFIVGVSVSEETETGVTAVKKDIGDISISLVADTMRYKALDLKSLLVRGFPGQNGPENDTEVYTDTQIII